jgi:two-component system, NarL family, nitrate/nitrite sensor histidine kinase NarX
MPRFKQLFFHSVMNYINLSLFTIVGIAMFSIFFSFWITDKADNDAKAINLSGSMRMQTLHVGLALENSPDSAKQLTEKLDATWNNPLFTHLQRDQSSTQLTRLFDNGYQHWSTVVKPALETALANNSDSVALYPLLIDQVKLTDDLVNQLQIDAEAKIRNLRTLQLFALLITTLVGSLIFYLLKNRVEAPLNTLAEAALRISNGELQQQIPANGDDELALLGKTFNQMSASLSQTYNELESRVEARTQELQRHNTMLEFLFRIARDVLDSNRPRLDYHGAVQELAGILNEHHLELCLFTSQGDHPYLQVNALENSKLCQKQSCDGCKGSAPFDAVQALGVGHKYPILQHETQYGVIEVQAHGQRPLEPWQDQLLRSTADQFAIALSLNETKDQEHRLAMLNERTVIARELHDSLAQSLSYLQIQVTRLQKSHDKQKFELQQPILDELREGLSSAYRHLRELLTTFRLKMDAHGLESAISQTVEQLKERSPMHINLAYQLKDLPLSPMEEIHLMQITREACQNAINHSGGSKLNISFTQEQDKAIELCIEDDGVGLSGNPEKLNHYGLSIMQERSRHLGGDLNIENISPNGTRVTLRFTPTYLDEAISA